MTVIGKELSSLLFTKGFLKNLKKEPIKLTKLQAFISMLHATQLLDSYKLFMQITHHRNTCNKTTKWNLSMQQLVSSTCIKRLSILISVCILKLMDMVQSFLIKLSYWSFKHFWIIRTSFSIQNLSRMTKI